MRAMPTDEGDDVVNKWALIVLSLFVVAFSEPQASVASFHQSAAPVSDTNAITGQNDEAKTLRYRSGRRYYNPTPNYRAPVRTTPRNRAPAPARRTGGFFGGIGTFFAGAFLGSMLFSPFMGGLGNFSLLGILVDVLMIYVVYRIIKRFFWRARH